MELDFFSLRCVHLDSVDLDHNDDEVCQVLNEDWSNYRMVRSYRSLVRMCNFEKSEEIGSRTTWFGLTVYSDPDPLPLLPRSRFDSDLSTRILINTLNKFQKRKS
jgi:hypothetical protein